MTPTARRRVLVGLCITSAVVCVAAALRPDPAASGTTQAAAATAGWSARRVPAPIVSHVAGQRLTGTIADAVAGYEACVVVDAGGRVVDRDASKALVPASTLKVLTAVGVLDLLPADHRFVTSVEIPPGADPTAPSQLFLVGGGDPLLGTDDWRARREADPMRRGTATTSLEALADGIVAAGVRSAPGGVVGVATDAAADQTFLEVWDPSYLAFDIGPVASLTVDSGYRSDGSRVQDPALYAAEELSRLLVDRGIEVGPPSTAAALPDEQAGGTVVADATSPPLADVVGVMLAASDNLAAELLVRAVTREIATDPTGEDSTTAGLRLIHESLAALGLPLDGFVQVDGSGLSRENRATCELLDAALALADTDDRFAPVRDGMSVAGEIGTLAPRLGGTPLIGNLAAKTGTLTGVSGLAGWITVGPELRFAFIGNGSFSENDARVIREDVALLIARHPDAPPADTLVPAP